MKEATSKPTLEQIRESPLVYDSNKFLPWAKKQYGKRFMKWVCDEWRTASEREIQVMHRAWIAAKGSKL